jgi:murein DD-endopeptidase MepM/ murein hydrolase activator NlpD
VRSAAALGLVALALAAGTARAGGVRIAPDPAPAAVAAKPGGSLAHESVRQAVRAASDAGHNRIRAGSDRSQTGVGPRSDAVASPQLLALWRSAGQAYGIPWQVLAAVNKVESNFGRNMGPSSAGAIGWMQFLPSTWRRWGVDADANGIADPWNATDAIYGAARYLAGAGGRTDLRRALFAYNHAGWYVDSVLRLARTYGLGDGQPPQVIFALERVRTAVRHAGEAVGEANARYLPALALARGLAARVRRLESRAAGARLLSERLDLHRRAVLLAVELGSARERARRLHGGLVRAQHALRSATLRAGASSFDRGAAAAVAAPLYDAGYAFPVGGGAEAVSVSHTHHDYPAADIAAPEGSPVYALADAVVARAWAEPDARCGIGLTLELQDGREWTYCHLSSLADAVVAGTVVSAGAPLGTVGSTGDATGPHLHLQLQPATSYPQDEEWFQRFAGTAFRWQDGPVFAVVG